MKNLMIVAVLALGSMTAFAQEETQTEEVAATAVEAVEATEAMAAEAVEAQDDFAEVAIEELPEAITAALATDFPGATISMAYVNEAAQYKLEVAKEDGTAVELYADAEGNWIEM